MSKRRLSPYQRIMRAARRGTGVRLSAEEAWALSQDDAIRTRADWDDMPADEVEEAHQKGIQPRVISSQPFQLSLW